MKELLSRIRRSPGYVLFAIVLLLVALAVVGALLLDHYAFAWLTIHPVTGNVIAGILGLPAAFLLLDILAERAIKFAECERWKHLRAAEAAAFVEAWRRSRWLLVQHYLEPNLANPAMLPSAISNESLRIVDRLRALQLFWSTPEAYSEMLELVSRLLEVLEAIETRSESNDAMLRERLGKVLLPRLEIASSDPRLIQLIREGVDSLAAFDILLSKYHQENLAETIPRLQQALREIHAASTTSQSVQVLWDRVLPSNDQLFVLAQLLKGAATVVVSIDQVNAHLLEVE